MPFGGEDAESYYDEGLTAAMRGEVAQAVECFEKATELDRSFTAAFHQLGKCFLRMGDATRASNILNEVVRDKPNLIPPRLDLGYALLAVAAYAAAERQFEQVIALEPHRGRGYLGLASVRFDQANWGSAATLAEQSVGLGETSFSALYLLGRAAKAAGNVPLAVNTLEKADSLVEKWLELNPNKPEGYYLRGEMCIVRDQFSSGYEQFRAAEDRAVKERLYSAYGESFSLADALARQGECLQRLGNTERARDLGERILKLDPNHAAGKALRELE